MGCPVAAVCWLSETTCTWTCWSAVGLIDLALAGEARLRLRRQGVRQRHRGGRREKDQYRFGDSSSWQPHWARTYSSQPQSAAAWLTWKCLSRFNFNPADFLPPPPQAPLYSHYPIMHQQTHCLSSTIKSLLMSLNADMRMLIINVISKPQF